jgi:rhodanese-related sulfurtransferase
MMRWKQFFIPAKNMSSEEAREFMAVHKEGDYTLLDVRQPGEYGKSRIPGCVLIPLPELTDRLGELAPEKTVIAY